MLQETEIDSLELLLQRVEFASAIEGRERAVLLDRMREMEKEGYDLAIADGTLELLVREALEPRAHPFEVASFEVITRMVTPGATRSTASVMLKVDDSAYAAARTCKGPVEALAIALRGALSPLRPDLEKVILTDYRVQILEPYGGAGARAAAVIEWCGDGRFWTTAGVSDNIMEATWIALVASVKLELLRAGEKDRAVYCLKDESWAV